jgi:hypothetical protein
VASGFGSPGFSRWDAYRDRRRTTVHTMHPPAGCRSRRRMVHTMHPPAGCRGRRRMVHTMHPTTTTGVRVRESRLWDGCRGRRRRMVHIMHPTTAYCRGRRRRTVHTMHPTTTTDVPASAGGMPAGTAAEQRCIQCTLRLAAEAAAEWCIQCTLRLRLASGFGSPGYGMAAEAAAEEWCI